MFQDEVRVKVIAGKGGMMDELKAQANRLGLLLDFEKGEEHKNGLFIRW